TGVQTCALPIWFESSSLHQTFLGELAQLVQSICLTSRGSLVRIQYSPPIILRRLSSAGSEHLPYKQRVTGSNPVASTLKSKSIKKLMLFFVQNQFINIHFL